MLIAYSSGSEFLINWIFQYKIQTNNISFIDSTRGQRRGMDYFTIYRNTQSRREFFAVWHNKAKLSRATAGLHGKLARRVFQVARSYARCNYLPQFFHYTSQYFSAFTQ